MRRLSLHREDWPLVRPFVISRMRQDSAAALVVEIEEDGVTGRGEGDRIEDVLAGTDTQAEAVEAARGAIEGGCSRRELLDVMDPGPARSAVDCALWDLEAKRSGSLLWRLAGLDGPLEPVTTVFTIGLGTPQEMAEQAAAANRPVLKLKIGREGDYERVAAVRAACPEARISVDANTGWTDAQMAELPPRLAELGIELIEQPFPPGEDARLDALPRSPVPVAADESCLHRGSLPALVGRYDWVNLKLDKAGGLTEALLLADAAEEAGLGIMVGCNVGTSLAMAPGVVLAQRAGFVDLDGPLLLARDRENGLVYEGSTLYPPGPALWG